MTFLVAALVISPAVVSAQSAGDETNVPRTPWGAPDLQGVWDFRTATPLERPDTVADKATLTVEEAVQFQRDAAERRLTRLRDDGASVELWPDRGDGLTEDPSGAPPSTGSSTPRRPDRRQAPARDRVLAQLQGGRGAPEGCKRSRLLTYI